MLGGDTMKLAIGSDHVGIELKTAMIDYIKEIGHEIEDFGPFSKERADYPQYASLVAKEVALDRFDGGILICGTGVGISIAANKVPGIRAAVCSEPYSAKLSKEHNNTNIIAFGSRVVGVELAKMIVKAWLDAKFEGGRHVNRIKIITKIEKQSSL